ncbi:hypothetical protein ACW9IK_04370 [Pseudomonas gingeri]
MTDSKEVIKVTLPAPHVLELSGGVLHVPALQGRPATAEVKYDSIEVGDSIVLEVDRLVAFYRITHIVSASDVSSGKATLQIDNGYLKDFGEDSHEVHLVYTVNADERSRHLIFRLSY